MNILIYEENPDDTVKIQEILKKTNQPVIKLTSTNTLQTFEKKILFDLFDAVYFKLISNNTKKIMDIVSGIHGNPPPVIAYCESINHEKIQNAFRLGIQDYFVIGENTGKEIYNKTKYAIERTKIRNKLRNDYNFLNLSLIASNEGFIDWNIKTGKVYLTPGYTKMLGYSLIDLSDNIDSALFSLLHPEEKDGVLSTINGTLVKKNAVQLQFRLKKIDGEYIWVEARGKVLDRIISEPIRIIFTFNNVTQTQLMKDKILKRLQYEETIAECSKQLSYNNDTSFVLNLVLELLLNVSNSDRAYIYENYQENGKDLFSKLKYEICKYSVKSRNENKNLIITDYKNNFNRWKETLSKKSLLWGDVESFPESEKKILNHKQIKSILVLPIFIDKQWYGYIGFDSIHKKTEWLDADIRLVLIVSDMIGAFLNRKKTVHELELSENQYKNLINNLQEGLWVINKNNIITYANGKISSMLGYKVEEIIGKHIFSFLDKEETNKFRYYNDLIRGGKNELYHLALTKKDGSIIFTTHASGPIQDKNNKFMGLISGIIDTTKMEKSKIELEKQKEKAQMYLDVAGVLIMVVNTNCIIESINQKGCKILGGQEQEIIGLDLVKHFIVDNEKEYMKSIIKNILFGVKQNSFFIKNTIRSLTGDIKIIEWQNSILKDGNGKIQGFLCSGKDVTMLTKAINALEKSEERLGLIIRATNDAIWDWNIQEDKVFSSPKWHTMLGYHPADFEVSLEMLKKLLHPDDIDKTLQYIDEKIHKGEYFEKEFRLKTRSGDYKWILAKGAVVEFTDSGEPLRMVGIHTDIDEKKKNEQKIINSEKRFQLAINATNDILWDINFKDNSMYLSPHFYTLMGYDTKEFKPSIENFRNIIYKKDKESILNKIKSCLSQSDKNYNVEYRVKTKSGTILWVKERGKVFSRDKNGAPVRVTGIISDITYRKNIDQKNLELLEKINKMNEELEIKIKERTNELEIALSTAEKASESKSVFLANISHELRTPLNSIIGFSQVLEEQYFGELNEKQMEYILDILDSGKHLLSLINDILDLSKIEAGKSDLEISEVNISHLIENSLTVVKSMAYNSNIELKTNISNSLSEIILKIDERKIKQVIYNLLSNAVKFTPEGGIVEIKAGISNHLLNVEITDTGIGIPENEREKVFSNFYQVKSEHDTKTPGTGLGLPLSKKIIEMHEGDIWAAEGDNGFGSKFIFTLPIK